jgi:hypothetical protein
MAPYVMQINMKNETSNALKYLGSAFYDKNGEVKDSPKDIGAQSTGDGGALEKAGGTDGLFGLIAYSCPDLLKTLVIYIEMPATAGTLNSCFVCIHLEQQLCRLSTYRRIGRFDIIQYTNQ